VRLALGKLMPRVVISVDEKITMLTSRDGGMENLEVKGILQLVVT
jgi:hypothetical protein